MTELFNCSFNNSFSDSTERHTLINNTGALFSSDKKYGTASGYFNGNSFLTYDENRSDFELGSTPILYSGTPGNMALSDNSFTLECWVKLEAGGQRYYPICSSFNFMTGSLTGDDGNLWTNKCGWVLQIDTSTGTLQMIGYAFGNWAGSVLQSPVNSIFFNTWTHIAIQSWTHQLVNYKLIYINGQSVFLYPANLENCTWTNTFENTTGTTHSCFYIGVGPRSQLTNPGQSWWYDINQDYNYTLNYKFKGRIDEFKLCEGNRYDSVTFIPIGGLAPSTTQPPIQEFFTYIEDGMSNLSETSLIPIMTSFYNPPITITSSGYLGSDNIVGAFRAFDGNLNTYWQATGAGPAILLINLGEDKKAINKYRIFCIAKSTFPTGWTLEGSNNLLDWTTLSFIEDYTSSISGFWTEWFYFNNAIPYQYYRLSTNIPPYTAQIKIGELVLVEAEKYNSAIIPSSLTMTGFVRVDTGGTPIASSYLYGGEISRAFDENSDTTWLPMTSENQWIGTRLNNFYKVTKLCLTVNGEQIFDYWKFQGSEDGATWYDLYTGTSFFEDRQCFTITNTNYYLYYRVLFLNWLSVPGLNNMELWVTPESISSYILSSSSSTTTYTTSTVTTQTTTTTLTFTSSSSMTSFSSTVYNPTTTQPPIYKNITNQVNVINANSSYIDHIVDNVLDESLFDYWECSVNSGPPYWIGLHFSESFIIDEYILYFNSAGTPKAWEFQGSNDNSAWTTLHVVTENFESGRLVNRFTNTTDYLHYRLYITEAQDGELDIRVDQIQIYSNSFNYVLESDMHYIGYKYTTPTVVKRYCFCVEDGSTFSEWKIQASNNEIIWNDIDIRKESECIGWKCIEIDNENAYLCWRLLIMKWGAFSTPGLSELEFYEAPGD